MKVIIFKKLYIGNLYILRKIFNLLMWTLHFNDRFFRTIFQTWKSNISTEYSNRFDFRGHIFIQLIRNCFIKLAWIFMLWLSIPFLETRIIIYTVHLFLMLSLRLSSQLRIWLFLIWIIHIDWHWWIILLRLGAIFTTCLIFTILAKIELDILRSRFALEWFSIFMLDDWLLIFIWRIMRWLIIWKLIESSIVPSGIDIRLILGFYPQIDHIWLHNVSYFSAGYLHFFVVKVLLIELSHDK